MSDKRSRIGMIDILRGLSVVLMVVYHLAFDLSTEGIISDALLDNAVMKFLEQLFASLFIVISGAMCAMSRNNLKRGLIMLAFAAGITVFTAVFDGGSSLIVFGVLHLLGASAVIYALSHRFLEKISIRIQLPLWAAVAAVTWWMQFRVFDVPGWLWIFGIRNIAFYSADYFPLFPYVFVYLWGAALGRPLKEGKFPKAFYTVRFRPLEFFGRQALPIYILHQPLCYGAVMLIERIVL